MAKKPVLGYVSCPECDHPDAEVREDKNALAYRYCPNCNAQFFTREAGKDQRLRARMRPASSSPGASVDASGAETLHSAVLPVEEATAAAAPAFVPGTPAKPRRVNLLLDE